MTDYIKSLTISLVLGAIFGGLIYLGYLGIKALPIDTVYISLFVFSCILIIIVSGLIEMYRKQY